MKIDIEKLRKKAGIAKYTTGFTCWEGQLERFADLVAADALENQAKIEKLYYELLYAVSNKYSEETRHQTALRYIQNAETRESEPAKSIESSHDIKGQS